MDLESFRKGRCGGAQFSNTVDFKDFLDAVSIVLKDSTASVMDQRQKGG